MVRRIEERGALRMAHGTLQICGRVFRYAVATGRAERDVSWDLRGALPPAKTKHLAASITDPKEVGPLLRVLDGYPGTLPVRCASASGAARLRAARGIAPGRVGRHRPGHGRVALHGHQDRHAARRAPGTSGGRDPS